MKKMLCVILTIILILAAAGAGLSETLFVDNREADKVYPERLNLRTKPDKNGAIIGLYYTGAAVEALDTEGDYTSVRIGGVSGYMASEYLITAEEAVARYGEESGFGACRPAHVELDGLWMESAFVLEEAQEGAASAAQLSDGETVSLIGILGDDWAYIAAEADGQTVYGYVPLNTLVDTAAHEIMVVAGSTADTSTMLYQAPRDGALEIMSIKNGTACFSLFGRKEGNWVKVRVGGESGWVRYTQADNLRPLAEGALRSTVPYYPLVMQTKKDTLLYRNADRADGAYMTLSQDMKVEVLAESGDAVYVRTLEGGSGAYNCGDYGYIALADLALAEAAGGVGVAQADDDDLPVLLMDKPQADAQVLGAMIPGAQVRISDFTQSDYVQVSLNGMTAYALKSQIRALGDGSAKPSERIPQRAVLLEDAQLLSEPDGEAAGQAKKGSRVYMLAVCGGYAYVQADSKPGFENGEPIMGFVQLDKLNAPASTLYLTAFVVKDKINMRASADRSSEIVGRARLEERLRVTDYGRDWTCVVTPSGKRGYVMTEYLRFE